MHTVNNARKDTGPEGLLEEYGDLLLEMEGTLESFEVLYTDIGCAIDDIQEEMERLQEHLDICVAALRSYHRKSSRKFPSKPPEDSL